MHPFTPIVTLALASSVSAHFQLIWPTQRGAFDEDKLPNYPCATYDTPSDNRTSLPINGQFPIQLKMGHTSAKVEVLIAIGNNPTGADYHTVLLPTVQEQGPQNFCIGGLRFPSTIGGQQIQAGQNATILVSTSGDSASAPGLYSCADITFTNQTLDTATYDSHCTNSSGVTATPLSNAASINANGSAIGGSSSTSPSSSTSTGAAAPTAGVAHLAAAVGAGAAGLFALL